ncbi:translocation/assembly module TamB domain-containing protein [Arenibacter sp. GZD96]|uniref:translocation/assembly module TamB domain-containing protein n=1 Tax=Aurantibrevibacter litoralis TaxID=3106030 RepID=UPI002AFF0EAC|nr:translocation/assembly module TamB domain-containing protein [Arenibacter sp. GZD-96]MEA1787406.1 translocation/assembly module TamB domain-containing protein [Arenibacter sp. GZD-96]
MGTLFLSLPVVQTNFARYATETLNEEFGTNIQLNRLQISLITFNTSLKGVYVEDYKKDTLFYIKELTTSILNIKNLIRGKLEFGDIEVEELLFKLKTYEGERTTNLEIFVDKLDDKKPRAPGTPPFFFSASKIDIQDSHFKLIDENVAQSEILNFNNLQISADDFQILGPEVRASIKGMAFATPQGISVTQMATDFTYTKTQMRFDGLHLKTPESNLNGFLIFDYDRSDFADFLNKVQVSSEFIDSEIALDEINLFYNEFGTGKKVTLSSTISGVLNDLTATNLFLFSDETGIRGDFNFKELFSQEAFTLNADIRNLSTSYYQLRALLPNILGKSLPSSFQKLGSFTIRGTTVIAEQEINAKVNINTGIGSSYADIALTNIKNIDNASYKGFVSLIDFDLGRFLGDKQLGKTTFDFNVEGIGFVQQTLNTEVIGQIYTINFNNYEYQDIKVSGIVKDQLFDGSLTSNDEHMKFNFNGLADFKDANNQFNFKASVAYADLKKTNFINDSVSIFKGDIAMAITGTTLDNITGDVAFTNTVFQNKNDTYYFDDFKINAAFENDTTRVIAINSPDIITGYVKGTFKVNELGKLLQNSIGSVYTNYKPFQITEGQRLAFNFRIYNKIVDVFFPEVQFDPNTFIRGTIIADEGDFKLTFKSPSISAYGNELDDIELKIDNKNPLFNTFLSVADVSTPYYDVKDFNLINTTLKDTLFFRTEFRGGNKNSDVFNLNFYHTFTKGNKSVIGLKTSDVSFKGNKWILNQENNAENKVTLSQKLDSIFISEIVMNNENKEQIRLRGQLADSTYKDLELQFKLVSLNKITPVIDSLKLQGEVNGILQILQKDKVYLPSSSLSIADLSVNDIRLGDLTLGIVGNKDLTDFVVNSQITDRGKEKLSIIGNITNREKIPQANLLASFGDFDLEPFAPLGQGVISNIRGKLNGSVQIRGNIDNPDMFGLLNLNNAGIAIPYLNVDYAFSPNAGVSLTNQTFNFQNVGLSDVAMKTKATLNGTISHEFFTNWRLDLDVNTKNERFLILNTAFEEEVLYYGSGYFNGTGRIHGPTSALTIDVDGATAKGTSLKIPISDVASVGNYSFINFIERNATTLEKERMALKQYEGVELNFDLAVTPDAEVEIVLDPKTGSALKGTGEGILLIRINTNDRFEMYGEFVTVTGDFNYKFGGVIDKKFKVKPGGTILWEGDPLGAQLNMEAAYSLNANPAPLLDNPGYTRRIPTEVVIRLTDQLERPTINFNIEFPGTSSIVKSELEYRLQDPTVEERNAFFLLAQGTFVNESSGINQQAVTGNLIQTASGLLNQVLGGSNDKFDLGVSYEQGLQDRNADIQTENRLGVTVSTKINERILINGRVGVPVGGVSETVVAGDVEMQILLNEEGTLSAKIFNRQNEIQQFLTDRQGYTQGIGLSYEVDFNSFSELIRKIFNKNKNQEGQIIPEIAAPTNIMGKDSLIQIRAKAIKSR